MKVTCTSSDSFSCQSQAKKDWGLLLIGFGLSFGPLLITKSPWSLLFTAMIFIVIYLNRPLTEVVEFSLQSQTVRQKLTGINPGKGVRVYSLEQLQRFSIEESLKKKGAYRLLMEFESGIVVPFTKDFHFSPNAIAQRTLAAQIASFTEKPFE